MDTTVLMNPREWKQQNSYQLSQHLMWNAREIFLGQWDVLILWNNLCFHVSAPQTCTSLRFITNKNYSCQKIVRSGALTRLKGSGISELILKKCSSEMSVWIRLWINRLNLKSPTKSFPIQFRERRRESRPDPHISVRLVIGRTL